MQAGSIEHHKYLNEEQLIWEIEISDLGACRPFLGFSLTNQYVLVGITAPNQQNEVLITSISNQDQEELTIPLDLHKFDFPTSGLLTFKGINRISPQWKVKLVHTKSGRSIALKPNTKLSLKKIGEDITNNLSTISTSPRNHFSIHLLKK